MFYKVVSQRDLSDFLKWCHSVGKGRCRMRLMFPNQKSRQTCLPLLLSLALLCIQIDTSGNSIPGFSPSLSLQLWSSCAEMEEERLQSLSSASLIHQTDMLSLHPTASEASTNSFFSQHSRCTFWLPPSTVPPVPQSQR